MIQAPIDGRKVADMTSHTLRILQDENDIYRWCWLVVFHAFGSADSILYAIAQKQLHAMSEKIWQADLDMAKVPLSTLDSCCMLNPIASRFYERLVPFFGSLHCIAV